MQNTKCLSRLLLLACCRALPVLCTASIQYCSLHSLFCLVVDLYLNYSLPSQLPASFPCFTSSFSVFHFAASLFLFAVQCPAAHVGGPYLTGPWPLRLAFRSLQLAVVPQLLIFHHFLPVSQPLLLHLYSSHSLFC